MPADAVYVGRPTKWGNPFAVLPGPETMIERHQAAVDAFRRALLAGDLGVTVEDVRRELRGRDLACWCPVVFRGEHVPCHADVLLEVANDER